MSEFASLKIAEVRPETSHAVSILFDLPEDLRQSFTFRPGQHLTLRSEIAGEEVRRNYSLCGAPHEGQLRLAIKRIDGGVFSNWAADTLRAGDVIDVLPPLGSFSKDFDPANRNSYLGIAVGSGITPILSLLRAALSIEPDSQFTLFYGNRDSNSVMFLEEIAQLKDRYMDRLRVFHFLSAEEEEISLFNGRLDQAKLEEAIGTLVDAAGISDAFLCGPASMMDAAEAVLKAGGMNASSIHAERFTADRPSEAQETTRKLLRERAAGTRMKLRIDGRARMVEFKADLGNILDNARAAGLPAPYACKAGVCATCRAKVVSGEVEMLARYGLTDEEIGAGYVLTCQTIPSGDGVELDYDA